MCSRGDWLSAQRLPRAGGLHGGSQMQKVEGNVAFHTAMATGFPQPAPGAAPSPGPMKVPDDKLRSLLGITAVNFVRGQQRLAIIDKPLQG